MRDSNDLFEYESERTAEGNIDLISEALYNIGCITMETVDDLHKRSGPADEKAAAILMIVAKYVAEAGILSEQLNHAAGHCIVDRGVTDWDVCRYLKVTEERRRKAAAAHELDIN